MTQTPSPAPAPQEPWICHLHARGYELDGFGHVNHAVYISYLEHARWELLKQEGITLKTFKHWKKWPVIAALEARYLRPVFLDDALRIETRLLRLSRSKFSFEQKIYRGTDRVFQAQVHAVMVNEEGRPTPIPEEILAQWESRGGKVEGKPGDTP